MDTNELTLWIQAAAVVAAVAAAIIALVVSALDRKNSRQIAEKDRESAAAVIAEDRVANLRQSQLLFEQEVLLRLLQNARHGGSTDPLIRSNLGAEAGALIGFFGPDRLPLNWENRVAQTPDQLRDFIQDESKPAFQRHAVEIQLELEKVNAEIKRSLAATDQPPAR